MYQCSTNYVLLVYTMDTYICPVVKTRPPNPPIKKFSSPCNEFMSVWSMFTNNNRNRYQRWFCSIFQGILCKDNFWQKQYTSREGFVITGPRWLHL